MLQSGLGNPMGSDRRLSRAVQHVTAHWFPVNETVLQSVRQGLRNGAYDLDPEFLFRDLKEDFALLTHCVKQLQTAAEMERLPAALALDPYRLIIWAGAERIKKILDDEHPISTHKLSSNDPVHDSRLRETAIAASSVELLSESEKLPPEQGFAHCVVRQVGLNLIAWNYPSVYTRAVQNSSGKSGLDLELTRLLGFSPRMLATTIMRPKPAAPVAANVETTWKTLDHLCEVGEALARANDPETHPSAEADWESARKHIERQLGPKGLELIHARILENTKQYRVACPEAFSPQHNFNPPTALQRFQEGQHARSNPFLKQCPANVKATLEQVYAYTAREGVNREALSLLLKRALPEAGFRSAVVFILDPAERHLFPQTVIGRSQLRNVQPVPCRMVSPTDSALSTEPISRPPSDIVAAAYECDNPLVEQGTRDDQVFIAVSGVLGRDRKAGVLYVELAAEKADTGQTLQVYKAIRHALVDALKMP
jgi:hypothetical protein